MKVVASSDWRDALPFETPLIVAEVAPGEPTRCATCGALSEPLPRDALWAVKHRHPNDHAGFVRFYCAEHTPEAKRPEPVAVATAVRRSPASRARLGDGQLRNVRQPGAVRPDAGNHPPAAGRGRGMR
jgi:hypothetical protein